MEKELSLFEYSFIDNKAPRTLFLFHGTGGTKNDLLFLEQYLSNNYNYVGLQGNVDEHGMSRFFKRKASGVFDQESITEESTKLSKFVSAWYKKYRTTAADSTWVGYSNGANMILAMLLSYPNLVGTAVLLHPMKPAQSLPTANFSDHRVLVTHGMFDPMIARAQQLELNQILKALNADLTIKEYDSGHEFSSSELEDLVRFLQSRKV